MRDRRLCQRVKDWRSIDVKRLDRQLLKRVAREAAASTRGRKNHNFHALPDRVQRFVNVMGAQSYVRPHRHLRPAGADGFEFFLVLEGEIGVLLFDDEGHISRYETAAAGGPVYGLELSEGLYHSVLSLTPQSTVFELKEGPYDQAGDKDFHPLFPEEGTEEAAKLLSDWRRLFAAG